MHNKIGYCTADKTILGIIFTIDFYKYSKTGVCLGNCLLYRIMAENAVGYY